MKATSDATDLYAYSVDRADRLPVRSVRIGPRYGTEVDREVREVTDLLRDHGYADVKVMVSSIPYRG